MKSKCSVWESVFRLSLSLLCRTGRLCWWREMRDFICTDRAEILPCTFNGLSDSRWRCHCACTDGGHFVLAKQWWFVCLGGHWWAGGQKNDPSVNTKQTSFSCSNRGLQNCTVKESICFLEHMSRSVCTRFGVIYVRLHQVREGWFILPQIGELFWWFVQNTWKKKKKKPVLCPFSMLHHSTTDDRGTLAFTGSIKWQKYRRKARERESMSPS